MRHAWAYKGMFIKLINTQVSFSVSLISDSMAENFMSRLEILLKISLLNNARNDFYCSNKTKKTQ
jgi:Tfp pilus assembly protein PilV